MGFDTTPTFISHDMNGTLIDSPWTAGGSPTNNS